MFIVDDRVVFSASDLAAAARCEYALLRGFDAKLGRGPAVTADDALLARTAVLGDDHEQRHLGELRDTTGHGTVIGRPMAPYTTASLTAAAEATTRAVQACAPLIYQPAIFDGRFVGFADFLTLSDNSTAPGATGSVIPSWPARPRSRPCCNWRPTPTRWPLPASRSTTRPS